MLEVLELVIPCLEGQGYSKRFVVLADPSSSYAQSSAVHLDCPTQTALPSSSRYRCVRIDRKIGLRCTRSEDPMPRPEHSVDALQLVESIDLTVLAFLKHSNMSSIPV